VQGRFGTVLVQVLKIEPEQVRSLEQVAGELKQELAAARAKSEIFDLYNKIEDARAEGKSLAEAAANLKLEARTIEAVDRSGRDAAGTPVKIPDAERLVPAAFSTDVGVERDPLQFQDGYIWYDVTGTSPSRERSLDEVKDLVESYSASPISWCQPSTWRPRRPSAPSKRSIAASPRTFSLNILPGSKAKSASRSIKVR